MNRSRPLNLHLPPKPTTTPSPNCTGSPLTATKQAARMSTSLCLLVQLPPNEHASDFACASSDLIQLSVPQQPSCGVLVHVSVATQTLDGLRTTPLMLTACSTVVEFCVSSVPSHLQSHLCRILCRKEDDGSAVLPVHVALIARRRHRIHKRSAPPRSPFK